MTDETMALFTEEGEREEGKGGGREREGMERLDGSVNDSWGT